MDTHGHTYTRGCAMDTHGHTYTHAVAPSEPIKTKLPQRGPEAAGCYVGELQDSAICTDGYAVVECGPVAVGLCRKDRND